MDLTIDFNKVVGKIKPMHGVGQGPLVGTDTQYFHYLKDANIPYARLHDVGGWFGGNMWVDIPNIFRDFEADENDENSYDFAFTDLYLKGLKYMLNGNNFLKNELFCEYGYVINLDENTLDIYTCGKLNYQADLLDLNYKKIEREFRD